MKIAIDPGHGGRDPGTVHATGVHESDIALDVGLRTYARLNDAKIGVDLTRGKDEFVSLARRVQIANDFGAALLAIHVNAAASTKARGAETWVWRRGGESERWARLVQAELVALGLRDRGVKSCADPDSRSLYVLRGTSGPAILVECGFLSHAEEARDWLIPAHGRTRIADAIVRGTLAWIGGTTITPPPAAVV